MRSKGFTLIELLAAIVLLGIILAIAVPSVNGVIENSKKKAFEVSANDIVRSAKLYYAEETGADSGIASNYTFSFTDGKQGETETGEKLALTGGLPTDGRVILYTDGRVDLNVCNNLYCACKGAGTDVLFIVDKTLEICGANDDGTTADNPITSAQVSLLESRVEALEEDNADLKQATFNNNSAISSNTQAINNINSNFLGKTYPVGSIYMSIQNTNPSSLFGGTWVAWGAGRVPVGYGIGTDSNSIQKAFTTIEGTGGEYTHTLTVAEIPDMRNYNAVWRNQNYGSGSNTWGYSADYTDDWSQAIKKGGGQSHNNLQPYITVYMWKRTS